MTFDVSKVVKGAGSYAFAITSPATNDVARFRSAEYGTAGRTASIYHTYHSGDQLFPTASEIAMARGSGKPRLLMLNWKVAAGYTWAQVAAGAADARIDC